MTTVLSPASAGFFARNPGLLRSKRQREVKGRGLTTLGLDPDADAVRLHQALADHQAEAHGLNRRTGHRRIQPGKLLEWLLSVGLGDAYALVTDADLDFVF